MTITVERLPDCRAAIRVQVPSERVESQRAMITRRYHQSASIPGFRPGKAPQAIVARRYGKQIEDDLREHLISEGYHAGKEQEGIEVLTPTGVSDADFHVDGTFSFVLEVITAPTFELPEYKGLRVRVPKLEITEAGVDAAIHTLRERAAEYESMENHPIERGEVARISYHGLIDGRPIREFAAQADERIEAGTDYLLMLNEPTFLPGFCEGILGMSVGDTRQVTIRLPEQFEIREIAGMDVVYEVTLKEIQRQILPDLNDEFARSTRLADDLDSLRLAVRERLETTLRERIDAVIREQVVDQLNSLTGFDVPSDLVGQATRRRVQELVEANQQRGLSDDDIVAHQEEILAASSRQAEFDVRTNFILGRIVAAEGIEATTEELQRAVDSQVLRTGGSRQQAQKLARDVGFMRRLRERLVAAKAIDLLVENAIIEEVEPPVPESDAVEPA